VAGIPDEVAFSTKPDMAWQMLQRAVAHHVPFAWVTGDCVYGDYRNIRLWLETLPKGYVLAVSAKEYVWWDWQQHRVGDLLVALPSEGWTCLSAGDGAKGPRLYDWLLIPLMKPLVEGWQRWLLVRRSLSDPTDLTAYVCFAPENTSLATLAHALLAVIRAQAQDVTFLVPKGGAVVMMPPRGSLATFKARRGLSFR